MQSTRAIARTNIPTSGSHIRINEQVFGFCCFFFVYHKDSGGGGDDDGDGDGGDSANLIQTYPNVWLSARYRRQW